MMRIVPLLLSAALSGLPFPPPKVAPNVDGLKCDRATVVQVMPATSELIGMTAAGSVTYKIGAAQLVGADGKVLGSPSGLKQGQKIRVYYLINDGAIVSEIDLEP
jgi:hypothetical protein